MKINRNQFNHLLEMEEYINRSSVGYKQFKKDLIQKVKDVVTEDVWYSIRDNTRQALQYVLFLSVEKGFFYCRQETVASKFEISERTMYRALNILIKCGVLERVNRPSSKQNGNGSAIHIVTVHPYYSSIKELLNLSSVKANVITNVKAENTETSIIARDTSDSETLTLSLPSFTNPTKEVHNNVLQLDESKRIIKYVPKEINNLFANIYKEDLRMLWIKINQAYTSIDQSILTRDDLYHHAKIILKRLFIVLKQKNSQNKTMSLNEQMAYVYSATRDSIYNALGEIAKENDMTIGDTPEEQLTMAKSEIKDREREYDLNSINVKANCFAVMNGVISDLIRKYKLLDDDLMDKLYKTYHETSLIKEHIAQYNKKLNLLMEGIYVRDQEKYA